MRAKNTKVIHVNYWKHGGIQHPGDGIHSVRYMHLVGHHL